MKLKHKDLKTQRDLRVKEQQNQCPLCMMFLSYSEAALDHDHTTGHTRDSLHLGCNQAEGRILSYCHRTRSTDPIQFLKNLIKYWERDYSDQPIHPKHLTPTEKELKKLRKHRDRLKTEQGKHRIQLKINALETQNGQKTK